MQDRHATYFGKRESGISLIGDLPWGSHFCQFYQTQEDLLETLAPYVRAGLEHNEFCVWVTGSLVDAEKANEALRKAVPRFEEYAQQGQVEIIPCDRWRAGDGEPGSPVVARLDKAVSKGFDGLRLAYSVLPEERHGREARDTADALCRYNAIAVFAYRRDKFDAIGLMEVVKNHRFALVKNAGRWEVIESSEARTIKETLTRSEEKLRSVFEHMSEGFAYHRIVLDPGGNPCDYVFLEVNHAFERLTGLRGEDLVGRRATQALPGIEADPADWIQKYGTVALAGTPLQFESYSQSLRRWYSVSAFSPHRGFFAVTFSDITERKAAEEAMQDAHERLQGQAEELQAQAEELQTQTEELQTQTEELNEQAVELRAANEELHRSEQALRISEQRVRMKLDSILSPDGDLGTLELADIIDSQAIQSLVEDFYRLARIPLSIVDLQGRMLVGVGWQEICTRFHRVHPETCRHCMESDTQLSAGIAPGQCRLYKCKNNMWDIATPLLVGGKHVGNLFSGQFFFEDEPVDRELFGAQAQRYGFDQQEYFAALDAVPRLGRESVDTGMAFLMKLARMLSQLSYSNIQLARSLGERDRLMESLHQSRERLNRAQEIAHLGSWELDLADGELTWSDEVYRLFGLEPQEFGATYEAFLDAVHPEDRAAVDAAYSDSVREGRLSYEIEHRVVRKGTGEIRWVHEKCQHVKDAAGKIVRSMGMVLDITQRKQMDDQLRRLNDELEEEVQAQTEELRDTVDRLQDEVARRVDVEGKLRKHSQMLEGFFQHTITPLAFMDRHFNFIRVNDAYAAAGGRTPEYFAGRNHFALYPHDENRTFFEQVVRTKQPYRAYAKPFRYPDAPHFGTTFWNWQLTPLFDERGEVQSLVLNLEDVTQRERAFQELERRAKLLQQLTLELSQAEDRERRRLAEILHDDLQQQLAAAKFHLGILGGRIKHDLSVKTMVGQLDQILKDAIEKSRSLSHELSPAVLYHSNLSETFEWLACQVQAKHGLTVHLDTEDQVHLQSEAMKAFLYKAAQEILFNIVKHARVREAQLRLKYMRGRLRLTIADRGQGFDPQTLERTGGFGLFSIRERIELLGGRMKVRSVKGRGSIFVIAMPDGEMAGRSAIAIGSSAAGTVGRPVEAIDVPSAGGPRLRVLLADDHKVMREGLAALLNEQADMDVVGHAGNGREAVNLACELRPDVVIMDVAMPLMAGDEATRQIKLHMPGTRVIALSMFEEAGVAETIRKAGAERYLLKTAPFEELLTAIRGQPLS